MSRLSASVAIALALAVTPATRAQTCALVQDLNTSGRVGISADIAAQRAAAPGNRFAAGFARIGNEWFFRATTIQHGEELWKTDGTAAGTMRISDIAPGALDADIDQITVADLGAGPRLWFRADDGTTGTELWTSDGTLAGTRRVADIRPGTDSSNPLYMIASATGCCSAPTTAPAEPSCG